MCYQEIVGCSGMGGICYSRPSLISTTQDFVDICEDGYHGGGYHG